MPTSKSTAVYTDKTGSLITDKLRLLDANSPTGQFVQLEIKNGNVYLLQNGQTYVLPATALPNTGTSGSGGGGTPPVVVPSTNLPPTALPQNGTLLASGDGTSLTTPFTSVTTTTTGASTASIVGGKYEYNIVNTGYFELGQTYEGAGNNARKLKFSLKVDAAANILNESNVIVIKNKVNGVSKDFLFIKLVPEYTQVGTKYNLVIRFAKDKDLYATNQDGSTYQGLFRKIYKAYTKGTEYNFELFVNDTSISLSEILSGTFPNENIEALTVWETDPATNNYNAFNLTGRNFDSIHFGEFYSNGSANFSGKYTIDNIGIFQTYVAPIVPNDVGKIAEAWKGWKNRYLKPNGMVAKDDGTLFVDGVSRPNVVSEAQAYGMLIAAQLGDKVTFDLIHNFNQTALRRSVLSSTVAPTGQSVAPAQLAYLYDPYNNVVTDSSAAPDADVDIALALIWAHERWGSTGTINYQAQATTVINDMKTYSYINYKTKKIVDGGSWNYPSGQVRQINPSYQSPGACKKFFDFTGDTFWNDARAGAYLIWKDSGDATLRNKVGAGVFPNWCQVNANNDQISDPASPDYSIDHSYDAFRCEHRGYWDHIWNPATSGFSTLAAYKLKAIYENEYNATGGNIWAERNHNNAPTNNQYENPTFSSKHWMTLTAANSSLAPTFKAAKLNPATQYKYHPTGSYFQILGYFGESWQLIYFMTQNNLWRYTNN